MKNNLYKKVLKQATETSNALYALQDKLDILLATLREEEIKHILKKGQTITIEQVQMKFSMGFATAYRLMDVLEEKGYIRKKGKKGTAGYLVIK
jgi:hypothetical protein